MAKGLPKSYIKKYGITKKAWREYRKSKGGKKKTSKKKTTKKTKRYTKKKTVSKKRSQFTLPMALVAPAINLIIGKDASGISVMDELQNGRIGPAMDHLVGTLTGYHPATGFRAEFLNYGLIPLVVGAAVHKFVGGAPLNINRSLAAAGVPILRI